MRTLLAVLIALVVAVSACYAATAFMNLPPPHVLYQVMNAQPSRWGSLFPARSVAAAPQSVPLPEAPTPAPVTVPWKGSQISLTRFLETTDTDALLVVRNGKVSYEWYARGVTAATQMSSWSVSKSLVSLMIGQAISRGLVSEDDHLTTLLPELRTGGAYDRITVRDLLDMTAGVDVPENYNEYWPFTGAARMYLTRDLPGFVKDNRGVSYPPGTRGDYLSAETQLLGLILARVTGHNLSQVFEQWLWRPVGASSPASWNLDRPGGVEKAFCCVNATARDFARIGQMVLDGGRAGGQQVVPASWIVRIATPAPHSVNGWGYSAQWWHPPGGHGGDYSAVGIHGQYVYVDPATHTVIVKLSDYGTEQDEHDTIDVFRAIAAS